MPGRKEEETSPRPLQTAMHDVFFVTCIDEKSVSFSRSAIYSEKETHIIDTQNIVNETDSALKIGHKIIGRLEPTNGTFSIIIKEIRAKQQPIASSDKEYLKQLCIYVDDVDQFLDFQELNGILKSVLGITVKRSDTHPADCSLNVKITDEDPGTKRCPFIFPELSASYPLTINFPKVSDETKKYLRMVYPSGKVTDTRIFAYRLIHLLLHRLGYIEHFHLKGVEDYKRSRKALHEGDPAQIPVLEATGACLCDWELIHFVAVQENLTFLSFEKMLCDQCGKRRVPAGVGLQDLETLLIRFKASSKTAGYSRTEKYIFYVIERREDGLILNESPYKSDTTINVMDKDWIDTIFDSHSSLHNIFIPIRLFDNHVGVRRGDKVLLTVQTAATLKENQLGRVSARALSFKIAKIIKRRIKIIHPLSLLSGIRAFHLGVTLKIGPDTDLNFVKKVAKIVNRVTDWSVKIDKSSFECLRNSYRSLSTIQEEWKTVAPTSRSGLVAKAKEIVDGLAPKVHEVEDSFKVIVYIFPEKYTFLEDVFGTKAFGEALHRIYAVVGIYPSALEGYETQEPCKDCQSKPTLSVSYRQQMTALFVIHEVLHIASGLDDHRSCSLCSYSRKEMQPLRRFYCEECIKEGNDMTYRNCLMSYECLLCIGTRLSDGTLPQFLCEKCRENLLPVEQFLAKQATRINWLIYAHLLSNQI